MTRRRVRRTVAVLLTGLTASMLSLMGPVAPAAAAPSCTDTTEVRPQIFLPGCDDIVAPATVLNGLAPLPNANGFIRTNDIEITFSGDHPDLDDDPFTFECQFYSAASPPADWTACTSPYTKTDLGESTSLGYTFRVRAIDQPDHAIDLTGGLVPQQDSDAPDFDQTPVKIDFKVDTIAPNTFITRAPQDDLRPDWPVTTTNSPQVTLNSNEAGTYQCTLNGQSYKCSEGVNTLRRLSGGSTTFVARAVDRAGNVDPTASSVKFYVPSNATLNRGSPWKRVKAAGYIGGDYLTAKRVGATLKIKGVRNVREVRLLAPSGPKFGKLEVRVGTSQWYRVNQKSSKSRRQVTYLVRDQFSPMQSGVIQIRVKSLPRGGSVRLDAYVARN